MKRLENLPQIAERQLGGLCADATLLAKIRIQVHDKPTRRNVFKPVLAFCAVLVLMLSAMAILNGDAPNAPVRPGTMLDSHAAGQASEPTQTPDHVDNVPFGSLSMSAGARKTDSGLFVPGEGTSFPVITLGNATYRLLESPTELSPALLGQKMGTVTEFNIEPALASGGIVSNAVSCGAAVHAVDTLGGALVAAEVEGKLRVFQRVSYVGVGIVGDEQLCDTLCPAQNVSWIALDGVGCVEGDHARALMAILLSDADYAGTGLAGTRSMQIGLTNGLCLQLLVGEDCISACGTWSCPNFFEAFERAVR